MTNKTKVILALAVTAAGVYFYSRMTPGEKEKFNKSFRKDGAKYLLQLLTFGLRQTRQAESSSSGFSSSTPGAQSAGQSNAAMVPSIN